MNTTECEGLLVKNYMDYEIYAVVAKNCRWIMEIWESSRLIFRDSYSYHNMNIGIVGAETIIDRIAKEASIELGIEVEYLFALGSDA